MSKFKDRITRLERDSGKGGGKFITVDCVDGTPLEKRMAELGIKAGPNDTIIKIVA